MQILINTMPRKKIIMESISKNGLFIYAKNLKHATEIANEIAPEHLEISTRNPKELLNNIKNAGAVFLENILLKPLVTIVRVLIMFFQLQVLQNFPLDCQLMILLKKSMC